MDLLRLPGRRDAPSPPPVEVLDRTDADVIVGFGGYVALPAYLAAGDRVTAAARRIPIVIHEANASAGIANKNRRPPGPTRARGGPRSGVAARGAAGRRVGGYPVRSSITGLDRAALRAKAREHSSARRRTGAAGVRRFPGCAVAHEAVVGAAPQLAAAGVSVLHAYGPRIRSTSNRGRRRPTWRAVPQADGSRVLRGGRRDLPFRCDDGSRGVRGRSACPSTCRCHTETVSRTERPPVVAAGGGMIVADAELTRSSCGHRRTAARDRARLDEMVAAPPAPVTAVQPLRSRRSWST